MENKNPISASNSPKLSKLTSSSGEALSPQAGRSMSQAQSGSLGHRASFAEGMRSVPSSPRVRHPSLTQAALQELLNHPARKQADAQFSGGDWINIAVGELVSPRDVKFVEQDTSVEEATKTLVEAGPPNVVLVRRTVSDTTAFDTFDFNDLNAYLLVVVGQAHPVGDEQVRAYDAVAAKARGGVKIPISDIRDLIQKPPLLALDEGEGISKAVEIFAGGVHRILITRKESTEVIGILSQWRLVNFLWDNGASFPSIEQLYAAPLRDLEIGSKRIIGINGDKPLIDALQLMHNESLTSLAVVDNAQNVVGNISTVDVKLLTSSTSLPLLKSSCIHFVSVILSERGVENGKDSFPVFHVTQNHTLAHTVNKLVATRSHRMWVVEDDGSSPSASIPPTPGTASAVLTAAANSGSNDPASPKLSAAYPAVSASAMSGSRISGKLIGVVSLTDVLNLFARQSGLHPDDPSMQRSRRRRSSSISTLGRPSMDASRSSIDLRR